MRRRSPFLVLAYVSLGFSFLSGLSWILVNPSDPHDDPRLWVSVLTFLWPFLLSPIACVIAVGGGLAPRWKHSLWSTVRVAIFALLTPFIGQIIAHVLSGWAG